MEHRGWMTSGAFAALCGATKETLRHYKDLGLLLPAHRGENGYFYYDAEQFYDFYAIAIFRRQAPLWRRSAAVWDGRMPGRLWTSSGSSGRRWRRSGAGWSRWTSSCRA